MDKMGAWKTFPPPCQGGGRGEEGDDRSPSPLPPRPQENIMEIVFCLVKNKQFYIKFRERKQDIQLVQLNTGIRKKARSIKIVLSCKVANYKDIQKDSFLFIFKIRRIWLKDVRTRSNWRTVNIEIPKYFYWILYKYLKIL